MGRGRDKRNGNYLDAGVERDDAVVLGEDGQPVVALGLDVEDGGRLDHSWNRKGAIKPV